MGEDTRIMPRRVALYYALFTSAYILLSDSLLSLFIADATLLTRMQTYKGWVFIAVTAFLIYSWLNRQMQQISSEMEERRQVEENLRRHLANLDMLHDISSAFRSAENLDEMLPILVDQTLAALNTSAGAISLYDSITGLLRYDLSRGWFENLGKASSKPTEGISGRVYSSGKPYATREFASDPLTRRQNRPGIPHGWGGACIPFLAKSETVGVLLIAVPHPREITSQELKLLTSLAELTGTALHRSILYEETNRRLRQLQSLRAVDVAITASPELGPTLDVLLQQVREQLQVDGAAVYLVSQEDKGDLDFAASSGVVVQSDRKIKLALHETVLSKAAAGRQPVLSSCSGLGAVEGCMLASDADGFATCMSIPLIATDRVVGILLVFSRSTFPTDPEWTSYLDTMAGQAAIAVDNAQLFAGIKKAQERLLEAYDATIEGWAHALDLRDEETHGHSRRVTQLTLDLASKMGFSEEEQVHVRRGVMLHDVGKMGIPDTILLKPGPLSDEEWVIMRRHPEFAQAMLAHIEYLQPALKIPYCHHEKWDGSGYPRGLQGEDIPLEARIFAVVDVYDALTSDRPYRQAWSKDRAVAYIREQSCKHFDPRVVELFLNESH